MDFEQADAIQHRTKGFALAVIRLFRSLPAGGEARVLGHQLLRSATSVAANYRAMRRARSRAEFVAKLGVVVEEADESLFWIELLADAEVVPASRVALIQDEANQLLRILASSYRTARARR